MNKNRLESTGYLAGAALAGLLLLSGGCVSTYQSRSVTARFRVFYQQHAD